MRVAVVGATGLVGREILAVLVDDPRLYETLPPRFIEERLEILETVRDLAAYSRPDVTVVTGDGSAGHAPLAPYDRISRLQPRRC